MNFKRMFTAIISLVLVCCLLVNVSPIKAKAVGPVEVVATTFILSLIIGLALNTGASATQDVLDGLVNGFFSSPFNKGYVFDSDAFDPQYVIAETGTCYIHKDVVEAVRNYLYDCEFIVDSDIPDGYASYNDHIFPLITENMLSSRPYWHISYIGAHSCGGRQYWYYGYDSLVTKCDGTSSAVIERVYLSQDTWQTIYSYCDLCDSFSFVVDYCYPRGNNLVSHTSSIVWSNFDLIYNDTALLFYGGSPFYTSESKVSALKEDAIQGFIAPLEVPLGEGYPLWHQKAIERPAEDGTVEVFYPVGVGNDYSESLNWLQEQVWSGYNTLDWSESGSDTDTDTGIDEEAMAGTLGGTQTGTFLDGLKEKMSGLFAGVTSGIGTLTETVADSFSKTVSTVKSIPEEIAGVTAGVLADVFIPADSYVDTKFNALTSNYTFANSIAMTGADLKEFLLDLGSKPPVIRINLSESTGKLNWGKDMVLIDFSFYEPYKPTMDAILSAFLWLWFCWRVVLALPGIISGSAGMIGNRIDTSSAGANAFDYVAGALKNTPSDAGKTQRDFTPHPSGSAAYEKWRAKQK